MAKEEKHRGSPRHNTHLPLVADAGGIPPRQHGGKPERPQDTNTCLSIGLMLAVGVILLVGGLGIVAVVVSPELLFGGRETNGRPSCQNYLKQIGIVCLMYANENPDGQFPPLSNINGTFMFTPESVYPEYLSDGYVLVCPGNPSATSLRELPHEEVIDDHSYYYFGYALTNEDEALAFLDSYPDLIAEGADFSQDLPAPPGRGSFGGEVFLRLRPDVCDGTDVQPGEVPVMFDVVIVSGNTLQSNHVPDGSNVLYLDGHVEFVKYPDEFPVSNKFLEALSELDR
jgi:prepilin-type processing-associated H-X9-DG protein